MGEASSAHGGWTCDPSRWRGPWSIAGAMLLALLPAIVVAGGPEPLVFGEPVAYRSGNQSHGIAAAQLVGDEAVDLVVANAYDGTVAVLQGLGGGRFAEATDTGLPVGRQPKSVMAADLDGDGLADLVTANQGSADVSVLLRSGEGFAAAVGYPACDGAHEAIPVDLDGDGDLDLAATCWGGNVLAILGNDGAGRFTPAAPVTVGWTGHSVAPLDADSDGDIDLAVASRSSDTVTIVPNEGGLTFGAFVEIPVGVTPHSVRAGDLDADGDADLAVAADGADSVTVLLNDGSGAFARADVPAGRQPKSVAVADVDGDGVLDLVTADADGNYPEALDPSTTSLSVALGTGDGSFQAPVRLPAPGTPFAVIATDLDDDGDTDLAAATWDGGTATVLLQDR